MKFNPSFGWHFIFWKKTEKGNCFFILGFNSPWSYVFRFDEIGWKQNKKILNSPFDPENKSFSFLFVSYRKKKRERKWSFFLFYDNFLSNVCRMLQLQFGVFIITRYCFPFILSYKHNKLTFGIQCVLDH